MPASFEWVIWRDGGLLVAILAALGLLAACELPNPVAGASYSDSLQLLAGVAIVAPLLICGIVCAFGIAWVSAWYRRRWHSRQKE